MILNFLSRFLKLNFVNLYVQIYKCSCQLNCMIFKTFVLILVILGTYISFFFANLTVCLQDHTEIESIINDFLTLSNNYSIQLARRFSK